MRTVGIILLSVMLASPALGFFRFGAAAARKAAQLELFARTFRVMQIESYLTVKSLDMKQFITIRRVGEGTPTSIAATIEQLDIEQLNAILELDSNQMQTIQKLTIDQFKAIQQLDGD